jgi:O-antigen ligase
MRLYSVAAAYALWLLSDFVIFYLTQGSSETALQVVAICGVVPAGLQLLVLGVDWRGLVAPMKIWLPLLLVILLGYVVNAMNPETAPSGYTAGLTISAAWAPIVYIFDTVLILAIATLVAGCPDRRLLRSIASLYCVFSIPFLIYIDLTGKMTWGRLTAGLESNNWGLMGLTVCVAAFARKPGPIAIAGFAAGAVTIFAASSREHILALAIILPVIIVLHLREIKGSRLWAVLAGLCASLIIGTLLFDPYILDAIRYVNQNVLLIDSPDRGLNSGFTGRTAIWSEAFDLWLKAPLLGIGFRQHERFLLVPAHNAYLAMLADTGLLGLILYLVLLIGSLVASWGIEDQRTRRFVVTALVGYVVVGFFDRRAINTGNPYGLLFLICCSVALVDQSLRKTTQLYRAALRTGTALNAPAPLAVSRVGSPGIVTLYDTTMTGDPPPLR